MKDKKTADLLHCVDCLHCDVRIDFDHGSHYYCWKKSARLPMDVIHRRPCAQFEAQPPVQHFGP